MTAQEVGPWVAIIGLTLTIIGGWTKLNSTLSVLFEQVKALAEWKSAKSIDKSQLDGVQTEAAARIADLSARMEVAARSSDARMVAFERKLEDYSKELAAVHIDVARMPEMFLRMQEASRAQHEAVVHSLGNLKSGQTALARRMGMLPPSLVGDDSEA